MPPAAALLLGAVVAGVIGMIWREVHVTFSYLARAITRRAARSLTPPMDVIREEEWLGVLADMDSALHLARFSRSLGFFFGAHIIRRQGQFHNSMSDIKFAWSEGVYLGRFLGDGPMWLSTWQFPIWAAGLLFGSLVPRRQHSS